jgi:hypothetical protein
MPVPEDKGKASLHGRRTREPAPAHGSCCLYTHPGTVPPTSRAHKAAPRVPAAAPPGARSTANGMAAIQAGGEVRSPGPAPSIVSVARNPSREPALTEPGRPGSPPHPHRAAPGSRRNKARQARPKPPEPGTGQAAPEPAGDQGTGGLPAGTGQRAERSGIAAGDATKERP